MNEGVVYSILSNMSNLSKLYYCVHMLKRDLYPNNPAALYNYILKITSELENSNTKLFISENDDQYLNLSYLFSFVPTKLIENHSHFFKNCLLTNFVQNPLNGFIIDQKMIGIAEYPFYQCAALIFLGEIETAYSIASFLKSSELMLFTSSIVGNFDEAFTHVISIWNEEFIDQIVNTLSSFYDFTRISCLIYLSNAFPSNESTVFCKIYDILRTYESGSLSVLLEMISQRNFENAFQVIPNLYQEMLLCPYLFIKCDQLCYRIQSMLLYNMLRTYAEISFGLIHSLTQQPTNKIISMLKTGIQELKLNGKLDLVNNKFIGTESDAEQHIIKKLNEKIQIIETFNMRIV